MQKITAHKNSFSNFTFSLKKLPWEFFLLLITALVFTLSAYASPYFLDVWNLSDATFNFVEKAIVALPLAMLIICRDIDLSVASIIALSSVAMGFAAQYGFAIELIVLIGIGVGMLCGLFNGWVVTRFDIPAIVVTIGTMSLFRGMSYILLGDQVLKDYPEGFDYFGQGYVYWVFSFEFMLFLVAVLLTSRLGSTRPTIALGWELSIITMVVLGGVNILGGSGTIAGVFIAVFLMGIVTFGLGLLNVPGIVMSIIIGGMLISVIATPVLIRKFSQRS